MRPLPLLFVCATAAAQPGLEERLTRLAESHWQRREAHIATLRTPEQIAARQAEVRAGMLKAIGGLPAERTPLNPRITGSFAGDGYRVENVVFESLPGFRVTANFYLPAAGAPPFPALLGVAGHSDNGKASATYQHAWISFARRGFAVLAFDPPGQGERQDYFDPALGRGRLGPGVAEHIATGLQCLLTGQNYARYEIWDGIRAFDYLLTRREVDPKRIAVAGNSGGGTQAAYLAVFEPRLAASVASCYITRWREQWIKPGPQDAEQVFAGFISSGFDFADLLIALAPRPMLMTTAIRDYFPIDGGRATHREVVRVFERLGVSARAGYFEYDDPHGWSRPRREAAYHWLETHFKGASAREPEADLETIPEQKLWVTPTGHLANSFGSETVQSLNRAHLARIYPARAAARAPGQTREIIARRLGLSLPIAAPQATPRAGVLDLELAPGHVITATLTETPGAKAAVLLAGVDYAAAFAAAGHTVMTVEACGASPGRNPSRTDGYSPAYQIAARTWLLGGSLPAEQTHDLLAAARYLAERTRLPVRILARGPLAVAALLATALDPSITALALERPLLSYKAAAEATLTVGLPEVVIPGVLEDFDLPDALSTIAPRPVWVVDPRNPAGSVLPLSKVPAAPHVRAVEYPELWPPAKVYAPWLPR